MSQTMPNAQMPTESERELKLELDARTAEADWLRAHYDDHLRRAYARIAALETELEAAARSSATPVDSVARGDYERLRLEAERLSAAEQRYIDRIEELKQQLSGAG